MYAQSDPADVDPAALIFARAAAVPNGTAVVEDGVAVGYAEFAGRAAALAHHLQSLGVGPESLVAVALDRSVDQLVAALAVLAAGGVLVPVDPSYPQQRLDLVLDDVRPTVVVTDAALSPRFAGAAPAAVLLDRDAGHLAAYPTAPPEQPAGPDNLAYVIYTSGSTGRPKGAMNTRRGLANRLEWMQRTYRLTEQDVLLQKTPVGFDVAVWECYWGFLAGARTVVAAPDGHADPLYLADLIAEHGVTVAHFVPSMLRVFLDTVDPADCGTLRQVVVSGEALTTQVQRRFHSCGLHAELDNLYGPAEAAIDVTRWRCPRDWTEPAIPIGRPVANTSTYVLDADGERVDVGVEGELYLGGVQVGRGYLRRPSLTAERFVPDPFASEPGARMYRTGDRARWRADGTLEFLGRLDNQVKLRGVRIELGEIESVLADQPGVRAGAAAVRGSGEAARLVAYVVGDVPPRTLRDRLREVLPDHTVPTEIIPVDELPLSPNGKLDRTALPAPEDAQAPTATPPGGTRGELASTWGEVLGTGAVDPDTDLAELGANSLHAARVLARIRRDHGLQLTLREVFAARTVSGLAALVEGRRTGSGEPGGLPSVRHEETEPAPSPGQQRMWFLDHLSPAAGVAYNVSAVTRLRGRLEVGALRAALGDVTSWHEQLRTSFRLVDQTLRAEVCDDAPPLPLVDLSDRPDPEREAMKEAQELAGAHIDLDRGPLMRGTLYRLADDDHVLVFVFHHTVVDGWAVDVFDRALDEAYQARLRGTVARPEQPPLTYRDFARWQRELADSPAGEDELSHWRRRLAGVPTVLDLPADRPRPPVRSHRGRRRAGLAPRETTAAIHDLAKVTRTTPYAVFLAVFGLLLRELSGRDDMLVASPTVGRPNPALEDVIGFFANTALVRVRPRGELDAIVADAHESALEAIEHQYVPFERLAAEFAPSGDLSRPPLAQVALAFQGQRRPEARLAGVDVRPLALDNGTAKFDLLVEVTEVGEELEVVLEYSTDLFDDGSAERMLDRYLDLLADLGASAHDSGGPPKASGACLHQAFAFVAAERPDDIAVVDGTNELTYAELDHAANDLAHRLVVAGARAEQPVGLCAERTTDLIVGVLAVLKAGAPYLPLDPRHPEARRDLVLADAGCRILLGDEDLCRPLTEGRTFVDLADRSTAAEPPKVQVHPGNAAYVIYTSGSTGRPKGVVVSHGNAMRLFSATDGEFGFGPDDVWTLFHSIAFDFSVWELWGALLYGGRLVVVPYLTSRDPGAFLSLLRRERVTVLNQTPTAFRQLVTAAAEAGFPAQDLRVVVFGGEALEPATLAGWIDGYGTMRPRLVNMYGITETTVHVTARPIAVTDLASAASPIGGPVADLRVHVLDENLAELPAGTEGEMYVGGPGVARGYLGRPGLTAERFVPDPFGGEGSRLYRTGDLAVRLPDGGLEFRGRADDQVQLHGFRIELGEVERALQQLPAVRDAVCALREDVPGRRRLVGYVVPGPGGHGTEAELRDRLLLDLPEHMVPTAFVELTALPLTANGKLDRAALPAPDAPREATVTPRTPAEQQVADAWSAVLDVTDPGVHDNFFVVGGDSIIAVRLAAALRAAGRAVSVEQVFLHPTIAGLAAVSDEPPAVTHTVSTRLDDLDPALVPDGVVDAYPTASMQLAILFECELADDPALYHDLVSVLVDGAVDHDAMERALATLVERHEILRTSFDLGGHREPVQFVYGTARIPLTVEDGTGASAADNDSSRRWWEREQQVQIDAGAPPLVRCHVLRHSPERFQVSVSMHHAVLDGWSVARLVTELLLAYDDELAGRDVELPALPATGYRDFVAAEQAAGRDEASERYWAQHLGDIAAKPLEVLPGRADADGYAFRGPVPAELEASLRRLAGELGVPLKSLFLAAHAWALGALSKFSFPHVVTAVQVNGRLEEGGSDLLLGLFLNMAPLRLTVSEGTWTELITSAYAAERDCQRHRRYPLARIQQLAGAANPMFEAAFNFVDFHAFDDLDRLTEIRPLDWWSSDRHSFPLMLEVARAPQSGLREVTVTVGTDSALAGTGARLGELVMQALHAMTARPDGVRPGPGAP